MRRPLIGIPCREAKDPSSLSIQTWGGRSPYLEAIIRSGGLPVLIPSADAVVLREYFDLVDGLLFTGGEDLEPSHYGESPHPMLGVTSPPRDKMELQLARWVREEKTPTLAICRGQQVFNVAYGGSLFQDIPSQCSDIKFNHDDIRPESWTTLAHEVTLDSDSRIAKALGCTQIGVNTLHHQSAKTLGAGLRIVGKSSDGIIEALEAEDPHHMLIAVQWHPETLWQSVEPRYLSLFKLLVEYSQRL